MKLYATVTSERASKGQGGNKQLHITILREIDGQRVPMYFIGVWPNELVVEHIPTQKEVYRETKGEKQKGECMAIINDGAYCGANTNGNRYCKRHTK